MKRVVLFHIILFTFIGVNGQYGLGQKESEIRKTLNIASEMSTIGDGTRYYSKDTSGILFLYFFDKKDECILITVTPKSYDICEYFYNLIKSTTIHIEDSLFMKSDSNNKKVIIEMIFMPHIMEHSYLFYYVSPRDKRFLDNL